MSHSGTRTRRWNEHEPSLDELLSDPACQLLMERDGTTVQAVAALIDRLRESRDAPLGN